MEILATDAESYKGTLVQKGNKKLQSAGMLMFNLPATKEVCGRACKGCYAIKEQTRYPSVLPARINRYNASKRASFAQQIVFEINHLHKTPKYFRVHASGEFYSQEYISKWVDIAQQLPHIIFYAYTKRLKYFDFTQLLNLPNFVLIDSMQYGSYNYGPVERKPEGAFLCPHVKGSTINCGVECTYCMRKPAQDSAPYFKQH